MNRAEALARAHRLAAAGRFVLLRNPQQGMENLNYDEDDVAECILTRVLADVKKDMQDIYQEGRLVLVFRPVRYGDDELYVKISVPVSDDENLTVLSFRNRWSPI